MEVRVLFSAPPKYKKCPSFGFICLLISVYDWLPRKNAALFIGLSQFIGTMGPMLAAGPLD
ncbi:hypothetical protein [Legionella sp. W05-934-2]|uniref:hypothetical protein n=1 Tax=Legionella sp. W05-934-2 TaxID=1198649 RepID=UPI003462EC6E